MKKLLVVFLASGLALGFSCKKKSEAPKPETQAENSAVQTQPPEQPEGKIITPGKFYQFEIDRLALLKTHKVKFLDILKGAKKKDGVLIGKIKEANKAIVADFIAMTDKAQINAFDYRKTTQDEAARLANEGYIKAHAEITEKIKQLQNEIVAIDTAAKAEVERLKIVPEDLMEKAPEAPAGAGPAPVGK